MKVKFASASNEWRKMKARYVEGYKGDDGELAWPTLAEVAREFGVEAGWCRRVAAKEKWREQRTTFRETIEAEARRQKARRIAKERALVDETAVKAAGHGMRMVASRLADMKGAQDTWMERYQECKAYAAANELPLSVAAESLGFDLGPPSVNAKEILALAKSALALQDIASRAAGQGKAPIRAGGTGAMTRATRTPVAVELARDDAGRIDGFLRALERSRIGEDVGQDDDALAGGQIIEIIQDDDPA